MNKDKSSQNSFDIPSPESLIHIADVEPTQLSLVNSVEQPALIVPPISDGTRVKEIPVYEGNK